MTKRELAGLFCLLILSSVVLADRSFRSQHIKPRFDDLLRSHDYALETVVSGLEHPWAIEFLPDGRILVTERPGRLRIIENGKLLPEPISGLPSIRAAGQGGLMDIALDPDYENNQLIYISYSGPDAAVMGTEVARAKLIGQRLVDLQTIFTLQPKTDTTYHFGSRLQFADDNTLLITLGDRGDRPRAQDLADHAGSLIRINPDGSVPEDNPFVGETGIRPEIYTYGNRNIQGIALHPLTRDIWTVEHGPQGGDELNLMRPGTNYGWPVITYGKNYGIGTSIGEGTEKEGMAQPAHYWVPSIATSGMLFYDGDVFLKWKGSVFVGSLVFGQLTRLEIENNEVVREERLLLHGEVDRVRDVEQGADGLLYIITDEPDGRLLRIRPPKTKENE